MGELTKGHEPHPRFDGADRWGRLSRREQNRIGAAALEFAVAWHGMEITTGTPGNAPREFRPFEEAAARLTNLLCDLADEAMPDVLVPDNTLVPLLLGPVCRECGCSERNPCAGGCGWVYDEHRDVLGCPTLCTACEGKTSDG